MQHTPSQSFRRAASRALRVLVLPVLALYLLLLVALYFGQDFIILHPPLFQSNKLPLKVSPALSGMFPFEVPPTLRKFDWTPDGQYAGIVIEPRQGTLKGTVIFYHGNNGTSEGVGIRGIGTAIAANGYRVVMVEYPGFGRRAGKADFDDVLAGCQRTFEDARKAFAGPLILAGESYGAGMAAQVAGEQGDFAQGLMLFVPWDTLLSVVQGTLPYIPARYMLRRNYSSIEALAHFRKPVLVAAAERDDIIPPSHGAVLAKTLPSSVFVTLKGVDHNAWYRVIYAARWANFLNFASGQTHTVQ